jgi:hypothetical protein
MRLILLLLISTSVFGQKTWTFADKMQSDYFRMDSVFCYAESIRLDQCVTIKIKTVRQPILSPIYITTNNGSFMVNFDRKDKFGWNCYDLYLRRTDQWKSIESGIRTIQFYTGIKWEIINLNSNLSKLKSYAEKN